jgi:hypothetical protein
MRSADTDIAMNEAGTSQRDTRFFLCQSLVPQATTLPNLQPDIDTMIPLCGDFEVESTQNQALLEFMKEKFYPECATEASDKLGNTCLDLMFARSIRFTFVLVL